MLIVFYIYIFPFMLHFTDSFQKKIWSFIFQKYYFWWSSIRHTGRFPETATGMKKPSRSEKSIHAYIYNLLIREEYIDFRFPAALWTFREDWTISTINDHYMAPRSSSENKTCVVATCVSNSFQLSCSGLSLCKNYPRINCYSVRDKTNENFFSFVSSHPPHNSTKVFSNLQ